MDKFFPKLTKFNWILIGIILIAAFIRLYKLSSLPVGLTNDEANNGYDAYSLLKTARDQWGDFLPITYLKGFGDYRLPLYTYTVVPSIALFGLNEFAIRFPSALFGILTILTTYLLAVKFFKRKSIGYIAALLLCLNPWHIAMSRVGIESNLGVLCLTLGIYLFILGFERKIWFYISFLVFGLSIYSYTAHIIVTPLIMVALLFVYRSQLQKYKKTIFIGLILLLLFISPLILFGQLKTANNRASQVNFFQDINIINAVNNIRTDCVKDFPNQICSLFYNKYIYFGKRYVENYVNHFSSEYLLINGAPNQYSVLPAHGLLYYFEGIFFVLGLFFLFRKPDKVSYILGLWILIAPIPDSFTGQQGHYSRYFLSTPTWQLIEAYGMYNLFTQIHKSKILILSVLGVILYEITTFYLSYTSFFPRNYFQYSHYGYKELVSKIVGYQKDYDHILISSKVNDTKQYIFYLLFTAYDPVKFQNKNNLVLVQEPNSWVRVKQLENITFAFSINKEDIGPIKPNEKILFIGAPSEFPKIATPIDQVKDTHGNVVFNLVEIWY
jgi:4-amino-4-deoxy-L-arabinose transferase-like glycosyltransferase